MGTVLVWVGLGLIIVGAIVLMIPTKKQPPVLEGDRLSPEIAKILEQVNALLEKFDTRLRPAVLIMVVGLALVVIGLVLAPGNSTSSAMLATVDILSAS